MWVKTDKVIKVFLYSPHVSDFIFEREDNTYYLLRKGHETSYYELTKGKDGWVIGDKL